MRCWTWYHCMFINAAYWNSTRYALMQISANKYDKTTLFWCSPHNFELCEFIISLCMFTELGYQVVLCFGDQTFVQIYYLGPLHTSIQILWTLGFQVALAVFVFYTRTTSKQDINMTIQNELFIAQTPTSLINHVKNDCITTTKIFTAEI
jgi:hypothetical protein